MGINEISSSQGTTYTQNKRIRNFSSEEERNSTSAFQEIADDPSYISGRISDIDVEIDEVQQKWDNANEIADASANDKRATATDNKSKSLQNLNETKNNTIAGANEAYEAVAKTAEQEVETSSQNVANAEANYANILSNSDSAKQQVQNNLKSLEGKVANATTDEEKAAAQQELNEMKQLAREELSLIEQDVKQAEETFRKAQETHSNTVKNAENQKKQAEDAKNKAVQDAENIYEQEKTKIDGEFEKATSAAQQEAETKKAENASSYGAEINALETKKQEVITARENSETGKALKADYDEKNRSANASLNARNDYADGVKKAGFLTGNFVDGLNDAIGSKLFKGTDSVAGYTDKVANKIDKATVAGDAYINYLNEGVAPDEIVPLTQEEEDLTSDIRFQHKNVLDKQVIAGNMAINGTIGTLTVGVGTFAGATVAAQGAGKTAQILTSAVVDANVGAITSLTTSMINGRGSITKEDAVDAGISFVLPVFKAFKPIGNAGKEIATAGAKAGAKEVTKEVTKKLTKETIKKETTEAIKLAAEETVDNMIKDGAKEVLINKPNAPTQTTDKNRLSSSNNIYSGTQYDLSSQLRKDSKNFNGLKNLGNGKYDAQYKNGNQIIHVQYRKEVVDGKTYFVKE